MNRLFVLVGVGLSVIGSGLISSGCGSSGGATSSTAPTSTPTAPTPTITALSISSSKSYVFIGRTEQMTASATMSNGTTSPPTGTWGSDASSVANVNGSGLVTGVGSGYATIFFDSGGRRATQLFRGMPAYGGSWYGTYLVAACSQSGTFSQINACATTINRVFPISFGANQTADSVSGTVLLGAVTFDTFSSTVNSSGGLTFSAFHNGSSSDFTQNTTWTLNSTSAGNITGSLLNSVTGSGFSGALTTAFRNYDDVFSLMRPAAALRQPAGSAARSNPGA